jgi:membrane fusion protein (multidrug efflux system)
MRALLLSLLVLTACKKSDSADTQKAPPAPPVKVDLVAAEEASTPEVLVLTGTIAPNYRSEVTADTQGKVVGVRVERGQRVKMGDPVVQLDVRSASLSQREAQANLQNAQAQKTLAEQECKRAQELLDKGAITRSEYDRQSTQCTTALQSVSAAQARAEMISKSVSDGIVRAPFAGIVSERSVSPGEWVAPGRALFTLVDDNPLRIELSVPEAAVRAIQKDQRVTLTAVSQPGKQYIAKVTRIGAEVGRTRSLIVEATLDPQTDLVPGMFAEAHVVIGEKARPVLPADAVVKRAKTWHVLVAVKGELEDRIVQLGEPPGPGQVSIVQGVAKGEKVVKKITEQTVDGLRVTE